jgi:hypothetical protein
MQLTGVDRNGLTSAGLVQDPVEKLRAAPAEKRMGPGEPGAG